MALWKESTEKDPVTEKIERPESEPAPAPEIPSPSLQRRPSASTGASESFFSAGVAIEGKIEGDGDVRIAGQFKGEIDVKGDLKIDPGAHITGKISAGTVTIEGKLDGNIVASAQVKLLESGQMVGDLKAKTLTVAAGSRMRGNVDFGWGDSDAGKLGVGKSHEKGGKEAARGNGSAP